jgi:hypothetical protein
MFVMQLHFAYLNGKANSLTFCMPANYSLNNGIYDHILYILVNKVRHTKQTKAYLNECKNSIQI